MTPRIERTAWVAAIVALALSLATLGRPDGRIPSNQWGAWLYAWAAAIASIVAVRAYLHRRAAEETEEVRRLAERSSTGLFTPPTDTAELGGIVRTYRAMERWWIPAVAPVSGTVLLALAWRGLAIAPAASEEAGASPPYIAVHAAGLVIAILVARFISVLARAPDAAIVRPAGTALAAAATASGLALIGELGVRAGLPALRGWMGQALRVWVGFLGAEQWAWFLLALYQPSAPEPWPAPFESRFVRRLYDPSSWLRSAADSLDYQFGFQVSRTWLVRFLSRAVVPFGGLQLLVIWACTTMCVLGPEEEGIRERWGRPLTSPDQPTLGPGWHWTWPWPIERIRRAPARRVHRFSVGFQGPDEVLAEALWTRPHRADETRWLTPVRSEPRTDLLGAVPVNFVSVAVPVEYMVTNLYDFLYTSADTPAALRVLAERALVTELATRDLLEVLGAGPTTLASRIRERIEAAIHEQRLGVAIRFVGLQGIHPPTAVGDAFEAVIGAAEEREANVLNARVYATQTWWQAESSAHARRYQAEAARERQRQVSTAAAHRFMVRDAVARQSPTVYPALAELETLRAALSKPRLYILATEASRETIHVNLEPRASSLWWDVRELTAATTGAVQRGTSPEVSP
jgi:regulator of protease activity HflC (stomatin/prohibitin superfamily)